MCNSLLITAIYPFIFFICDLLTCWVVVAKVNKLSKVCELKLSNISHHKLLVIPEQLRLKQLSVLVVLVE